MEPKDAKQGTNNPHTVLEQETERIHIRVQETLKRDFTAAAAAHGLKPSAALKQLMLEYVKQWKNDGK